MRLVIDLDDEYENLFLEVVKAAKATIVVEEVDIETGLPDHVKRGIEKGLEQVKNGQTKSYEEVKKILADRWG